LTDGHRKSGVRSRGSLPKMHGGANRPPESDSTAVAARVRIGVCVDEKRVYEKHGEGNGDKLLEDFENRSIEKLKVDRNDHSECQSD